MGITGYPGALVVFGQAPALDYNPDVAPSMFQQGAIILDPRSYYTYNPGQAANQVTYGWWGIGSNPVIDQVPTVISTNSLAQKQQPVAGTALTLTASNSNNVTISQTITNAVTGASVTVWAIDGVQSPVTYGSDANIASWSPTTAIQRAITLTTSGTDAGSYDIAGFDMYGYPVSETIAASTTGAANTLTSAKTYKYIASITPAGTINSTAIIAGVSDTFGLPLYVSNGAYVRAYMGNALILSSTNITAGATATATSTTADVRGTLTSSLASDGTRRLVVFITPNVSAISSYSGLVGVTQYSTTTYTY